MNRKITEIVHRRIIGRIRQDILRRHEGESDSVYEEQKLALQYGVRIKTVREVLASLEQEGKASVTGYERRYRLGVKELRELFETRESIEGMAARIIAHQGLAPDDERELRHLAERIDRYVMDSKQRSYELKFHRRIVELCGNNLLARLYGQVEPLLEESLEESEESSPESFELDPCLKQRHGTLVDALQSGNEETAERVFREHCTKVINFILSERHADQQPCE